MNNLKELKLSLNEKEKNLEEINVKFIHIKNENIILKEKIKENKINIDGLEECVSSSSKSVDL